MLQLPLLPDCCTALEEINDRLAKSYGPLPRYHRPNPLSQLIRSLIGARTLDWSSDRAFDALQRHFYPWETLLTASDSALLRCLEPVRFADKKAQQLRSAMRMIQARTGSLCLDFLANWSVEDAQTWLRELPGVDVKVSAAVLNFSTLRKRVLVVDCHYFRVAKRLGLLQGHTPFTSAQRVLMNQHVPVEWTADDLGDHFTLVKRHGQTLCHEHEPLCWLCPLQDRCPTGTGRACV